MHRTVAVCNASPQLWHVLGNHVKALSIVPNQYMVDALLIDDHELNTNTCNVGSCCMGIIREEIKDHRIQAGTVVLAITLSSKID